MTNNDMIINGKIIEENNKFIKFGSYHGIFNIDRKQIKEIYRTESFEADIKIFKDKGIDVNETEVKTNYESGLEKIEENKKTDKEYESPLYYKLVFSPFYHKNFGKLKKLLPYSYGTSITCDIPVGHSYARLILPSDIRTGISYFHSEKAERKTAGFRVLAGPLWQFPLSIGAFHFNYCFAPEIAIGRYVVNGIYDKTIAVKWDFIFITGPIFNISSIILCPNIKFDYIYDDNAPLYGIGLDIGIGYRF